MKKSLIAAGSSLPLILAFLISACSTAENVIIENSTWATNNSGSSAVISSTAPPHTTPTYSKFPENTTEAAPDPSETTPVETTPAPPITTTAPITHTNPPEPPIWQEDENWAVYVIGNSNPLPNNYKPQTKAVAGERLLDIRCADYAIQMLNDASAQGVGLYVTSSYRSIDAQRINLQNYINTLIGRGYSQEDAVIQAHKEIALPGCSEHNAGLAMDIVSNDYWVTHDDLDESFEQLPQFDWLIENSWKYGFVLSYPKGKEDITGFIYEPWHYRFVGLSHAKKIHEIYESTGEFLTVNEYVEQYMR